MIFEITVILSKQQPPRLAAVVRPEQITVIFEITVICRTDGLQGLDVASIVFEVESLKTIHGDFLKSP